MPVDKGVPKGASGSATSTYIKICGVRTLDIAQNVAHEGANAIGFVFYAPSPRAIDIETAASICAALPSNVDVVALLVNAEPAFVRDVIARVNPDILQFHGDEAIETPAYCAQFGKPYWKALRVNASTDLLKLSSAYATAARVLLDADGGASYGGTGEGFDWSLIPQTLKSRIILSGGLNADNVGQAIRAVAPWGVDVSSGVESSRGVKSAEKIGAFIRAVRSAEAAQ
jgi:phosphoribosylanthranilate isomerase